MRLATKLATTAALITLALLGPTADARVTRIEIRKRDSPAFGGKRFGTAGQYEILSGVAYGELDPADPLNTIVTDIALAPRNARGMVEYRATFTLIKPVVESKFSGVMLYEVPNRGHSPAASAFYPIEDDANQGRAILVSGWQGDLAPAPDLETISVPVATNPDGSSITGIVLARLANLPAGTTTASLEGGFAGLHYQRPVPLDTAKAELIEFEPGENQPRKIPPDEWTFADCANKPFPGEPDPAKICVKAGFDAGRLYQVTFTAKDPLVLGLGLAATRDVVSFFRYSAHDDSGVANPLTRRISHAIAFGTSQSGNFLKTFINLGFNEDEKHRIVWDGLNANIAGRQTPINFRFAIPGGAATLYEPGSEGVLWWSDASDARRGRSTASLLDRCRGSNTCPKIFETFGSTEFWDLRMSPALVGTSADGDIPLPANARRYYFPGVTHGGGAGGFERAAKPPTGCTLDANTNASRDTMRALRRDLIDWVVDGTVPPDSVYPTIAAGELVQPTRAAMGFPYLDGALPDGLMNEFFDYDFGPRFRYNDLSGVITTQPPRIKQTIPQLVPRVDGDGNEVGGIGSPLHQNPLGTYLGWNVTSEGYYKGAICSFNGGYIPFAKTKTERVATGDSRLSLEERYGTHDAYVAKVKASAAQLVERRLLVPEDADRIVAEAQASSVLR
ncbi:MAG: alpha/beta hydrolase domain-containing protein [Candidatus Acidiferrales bacterium]